MGNGENGNRHLLVIIAVATVTIALASAIGVGVWAYSHWRATPAVDSAESAPADTPEDDLSGHWQGKYETSGGVTLVADLTVSSPTELNGNINYVGSGYSCSSTWEQVGVHSGVIDVVESDITGSAAGCGDGKLAVRVQGTTLSGRVTSASDGDIGGLLTLHKTL